MQRVVVIIIVVKTVEIYLKKKFKVSVSGSPNSCIVRIGKQKFRTLVDTGAECSLMHRRVYDQLKNKPRLNNKKACLQSANGSELKCDGCISYKFVSVEPTCPKISM